MIVILSFGAWANAAPTPPPVPRTDRFDVKVRELFFDGFPGDKEALDEGMKQCEEELALRPDNPEALVWHGSGLLYRSGRAFAKNDAKTGMEPYGRGRQEVDRAVALAPRQCRGAHPARRDDHLGFTRSSAFRRTTAARLVARFPIVSDYLADGRLCLTTLVELRDVLEEPRPGEILDRAAGRTEEQVRELVAALRPRPAPMDLLRRLPEPRTALREPVSAGAAPMPPALARPAPRVEPISEELRVLRMTVGREFVADLESVRAALSHRIPDGNLEKVLHACIRHMLRDCERRRRGSGKPREKSPGTVERATGSRYIPASVRDEVWRRDEGRCTFVGTDGHRCGSTYKLELHHIHPFAKGGPPMVGNLTLACSIHNRFLAEKDYGTKAIARAVAEARGAAPRTPAIPPPT